MTTINIIFGLLNYVGPMNSLDEVEVIVARTMVVVHHYKEQISKGLDGLVRLKALEC